MLKSKNNPFLILIKPGFLNRKDEILRDLSSLSSLRVISTCLTHLSTEQASLFYAEHINRPFYNDLIKYMTEDQIMVLIVRGDVESARKAIGPTDPAEAADATIRGKYGLNKQNNAVHCSDSVESGDREVKFFLSRINELFD